MKRTTSGSVRYVYLFLIDFVILFCWDVLFLLASDHSVELFMSLLVVELLLVSIQGFLSYRIFRKFWMPWLVTSAAIVISTTAFLLFFGLSFDDLISVILCAFMILVDFFYVISAVSMKCLLDPESKNTEAQAETEEDASTKPQ